MDRGGTQISIYKAFYWKTVPIFKMFDGSKTMPMCLILVWAMHPKKEIYSNAFRQHVELF